MTTHPSAQRGDAHVIVDVGSARRTAHGLTAVAAAAHDLNPHGLQRCSHGGRVDGVREDMAALCDGTLLELGNLRLG
eukprot:scaffold111112_cov72-Phaeocystis_antarctica.AAC.2